MIRLLIPVKKYKKKSGYYVIPDKIVASSAFDSDVFPVRQLNKDLKKHKRSVSFIKGFLEASIMFRRDMDVKNPEQYQLTITAKGIEIISGSSKGAYYAVQTLRDLIKAEGVRLSCCYISDWPDFSRRGVYHDCSRGKVPTVNTLKSFIERLAHWKINELQLYIENIFTFKKHPQIGKGYSSYTPKDLLEIQKHCELHHIRFVPSLASFGHMEKILALPRYQSLAEMPGFRGFPGGTTVCPKDPGSIKLIADMYDEFLPLFKAVDFNACGDEPWELGKGRSKKQTERLGTGRVYLDFILKIHKLCLKHNKRMNMWGDIVLQHPDIIPLIPKDIVLLNWDYAPSGKRIARTKNFADAGLSFVCCPGTNGWQSHGTRLKQSIENVSAFSRTALRHGAEGLLNTDWGDYGHRNTLGVSLCSFAHGAAHSWHTKGVDDKKHVNNFTFHVFGDKDGSLADSLTTLSETEKESGAYHVLVESLKQPESLTKGFARGLTVVDDISLNNGDIRKRLEQLGSIKWPKPEKTMELFEAIALREFTLAAEMNSQALTRLLLAKEIRSGKIPSSGELLRHKNGMKNMAENFSRVWRLRNRPSRLNDNMAGFKAAIKEIG